MYRNKAKPTGSYRLSASSKRNPRQGRSEAHTHTHTLVRIESNHKLARPRPAKDFDSFKLGLFPAAAATSSGPWCHINSLVVIVIIIISNIIIVLVVDVDVVVVVYLAFIIASLIAN